jgi:cytochrome c-type biogenesis protein CcmE
MTRYKAFVIPAVGVIAVVVGFLVFGSLNDNLVYFHTPTEAKQIMNDSPSRMRLGGQVVTGSVHSLGEEGVSFVVTDGTESVTVVHSGAPQQLFQEGIGVIVEGRFQGAEFHSDTMLIKHDEQYRSEDGPYDSEHRSEDS